jgi:hypothetical protein
MPSISERTSLIGKFLAGSILSAFKIYHAMFPEEATDPSGFLSSKFTAKGLELTPSLSLNAIFRI